MPFLGWALENGYSDTLTIDRIDNSRGYEPSNCRWLTLVQQNSNRTSSLPPFAAFGETKTLKEWARDSRCVVPYSLLWRRLFHWDPPKTLEWALVTPQHKNRRPRGPHTAETKAKISASKRARISRQQSPLAMAQATP
jgi:hypothetical protein